MANEYFNFIDELTPGSFARSAEVNRLFREIESGFALLPPAASDFSTGRAWFAGELRYQANGGQSREDLYLATMPVTRTSLNSGDVVNAIVPDNGRNTGASALKIDSNQDVRILRQDGSQLQEGDLVPGLVVTFIYNAEAGVQPRFQLMQFPLGVLSAAQASATAAANSATEAETSATEAETSATEAETSATEAETSATEAETSATNAANSATEAETSATEAAASATAAETSAINASLGIVPIRRGGTGAINVSDARTNLGLGSAATRDTGESSGQVALLQAGGLFLARQIPNLSASKITSGTFNEARIPSLNASRITTGVFNNARIPNFDVSKITSGVFSTARIPNLDASKITTGVMPLSRGGTGANQAAGARANLGLGTAATRDVGTDSGNLVEVGSDGTIDSSLMSFGSVSDSFFTYKVIIPKHDSLAGRTEEGVASSSMSDIGGFLWLVEVKIEANSWVTDSNYEHEYDPLLISFTGSGTSPVTRTINIGYPFRTSPDNSVLCLHFFYRPDLSIPQSNTRRLEVPFRFYIHNVPVTVTDFGFTVDFDIYKLL